MSNTKIVEVECPEWGGTMSVLTVPADAATELAAFSRDESLELAPGAASNATAGLPIRRASSPAPLSQWDHAAIRYVPITKPTTIAMVTGVFAPFNSVSEVIWREPESPYREMLTPASFLKSLRTDDVEFVSPGHSGKPLGSTEDGRLKIFQNAVGMRFELAVPPTSACDELLEGIRRKVFKGMSMRFVIDEDAWTSLGSDKLRIILAASLCHISTAKNPAQVGTEIRIAKEAR